MSDYLAPTTQALSTALLGPAFAGWIAHLLFCGVLLSHFSAYLATDLYARDSRATKLLLWTIVLLDGANAAMNFEQIYHYGTDQHRDFWSVSIIRVFDSVPFLLTAVSGAILQSFLTRRASKLFHSNVTAQQLFLGGFHLLIAVALLAEVGEMVIASLVARDPTVDLHGFTFNNLGSTWLWVSTFVDGSLSLALFLLLRRRFEGNLQGIRSVVRVSFQTALLTSLFSLTGAICGVVFDQKNPMGSNIILSFCIPLSSLYALSLVVTLASRQEHVAVVVGATLADYQHSGLSGAHSGAQAGSKLSLHLAPSGEPLVARRGLDSDGDEDEEEDEKGVGKEGKAENGRGGWGEAGKEVDVELGTDPEEDDGSLEPDGLRTSPA